MKKQGSFKKYEWTRCHLLYFCRTAYIISDIVASSLSLFTVLLPGSESNRAVLCVCATEYEFSAPVEESHRFLYCIRRRMSVPMKSFGVTYATGASFTNIHQPSRFLQQSIFSDNLNMTLLLFFSFCLSPSAPAQATTHKVIT